MEKDNLKYIAYCRKSTDESNKQIQSLDTQLRILTDFIKTNNLNCTAIIQEAKSAMQENNRPEFNKILDLINSGEINSILVVHLDRLSRNRIETGKLIDLYSKGKLKEIRTPYRTFNTMHDLFSMDFEFIFSAQYSDRLSMRVKEGYQSKLHKGEFPGVAKIGYLNKDHKIIPDPEISPFIKLAFETYARGDVSLQTLTETLYDRGLRTRKGKKLHLSGVERVLKGVFYTGKFYFNGILYEGSHEPLVSEELFSRVQKVLSQRSWSKPLVHLGGFVYRGYLRCAVCGCAITSTRKKNHNYYFCTNKKYVCDQHKNYLREEKLTEIIGSVLENITFDKDMAEKSLDLYYKSLEKDAKNVEENNQKIIKLIDSLKEKKSTLVDLLLNKNIDKETYNKKYEEINSEIKRLENKISSNDSKNINAIREYVGTIKNTGISIKEIFDCDDYEVKRDLMKSLCWNLELKDEEITSVQYKMPWKLFVNVSKSQDIKKWLGDRESNPN